MAVTDRGGSQGTAVRAAPDAARRARASTCSATRRARSSTSARRSRSASASPSHFSNPSRAAREMVSDDRPHRVRPRRQRGRGAAGRAELHQAVQAALQRPAARRQVLSVHRDLDGRGVPARLLHARAPPPRPRCTSGRTRTPSASATRSTCSARSSCSARATGAEPGRRSGSPVPGLLHQALRGALRRLRRRREEYWRPIDERHRLPVGPLPRDRARPRAAHEGGRRRAGVRAGRARAQPAAAPSGRCSSASASPTRRSARSTRSPSPSTARTRTPRSSRSATACSSDRQSFYLANDAERGDRRGRRGVRPAVLRERDRRSRRR